MTRISASDSIRNFHTATESTESTADHGPILRGGVYWVDFPEQTGTHMPEGRRPAIVLSNNAANAFSEMLTVIPLTTQIRRLDLLCHVLLYTAGRRSMACCEHVNTIPVEWVVNTPMMGMLEPYEVKAVEDGLLRQLGMS